MGRLQKDDWTYRIEDVLRRCDGQSAKACDLILEIHELLETGPADICSKIKPEISRRSLQSLLDGGALESAALRLVANCGFMLSGGPEGQFIATILMPSEDRDYSYNATSGALALCGAFAIALQESVPAAR